MGLHRFAAALILIGMNFWTMDASAQHKAAAEALFRSGREAAAQGDWATACERFAASNRLESVPGTVLNLGRCQEEQGQVASAWQSYTEAAHRFESNDPRRDLALQRAEALEPRLPRLTLELPRTRTDVTIHQNGTPLEADALGVPLPVDPGVVELVVEAAGHEPWKVTLELREGEHVVQKLSLGAPIKERNIIGGSHDAPEGPPAAQIWGYTTLGVGVAGFAVGSVFGLQALSAKKVMDDHCVGSTCDADGYEASRRGSKAAQRSTIAAAVGVVGAGVGLYLLLFEARSVQAAVSVEPTVAGGVLNIGGVL